MIQHAYNPPYTANKMHNTLNASSGTVALWRWLQFLAETCRSNKSMYCTVRLKLILVYKTTARKMSNTKIVLIVLRKRTSWNSWHLHRHYLLRGVCIVIMLQASFRELPISKTDLSTFLSIFSLFRCINGHYETKHDSRLLRRQLVILISISTYQLKLHNLQYTMSVLSALVSEPFAFCSLSLNALRHSLYVKNLVD